MSLLATIAATAASLLPAPAPLTPPVAAAAARTPDRELRLIVQQQSGRDLTGAVNAAGGLVERRVGLINALVVRAPARTATRLAGLPGVRAVSLDAGVDRTGFREFIEGLGTAYNQSIGAHKAWAYGITGKGVGVAVVDSGIQGDLVDFQVSRDNPSSRVSVNAVVNPAATTPGDAYGHGTHVAGLIAGNGLNRPATDPASGRYVGVAPEANLIAVKAGDDLGEATVLDVIDGLQFAVDHRTDYGIRVVNLSLSSRVAESHLTDPLDAAVEAVWKSGIVVVAAVGNRGADPDAVNYAPGNDPWVISVGGVDDMGTARITDDQLAAWSSRGITQDGYEKPDIVAPGAHMVSTVGPDAAYRWLCPYCVVDGGYFRVGGSSMAAAVVSGAVADLLQAHPGWAPDQVKRAVKRRSRAIYDHNEDVVDAQGDELPDVIVPGDTIIGGEISINRVLKRFRVRDPAYTNRDLPLNELLDPATGALDYTRTSWSRTSWSDAVDPLRTSWSRTSWSRTSWSRTSWSASPETCVELERTSWSRTSWSAEELESARAECDVLLAAIDPTRTSWSRTSWSRTSWSTSFTQ